MTRIFFQGLNQIILHISASTVLIQFYIIEKILWNEFSEQHQHQGTKKTISNAYFALFVTKGVNILVGPKDIYFGKTT